MTIAGSFADGAGRYRLDSLIAVGGMGEVWRATDILLGREVAIKVLKPEYAGDPVFRTRFEAEGRHAASLHHPGIASVYDVGETIGPDGSPSPYLVMELVEGQPLSSLLRPGETMEPDVVRDLLAQAGDALGAAHDAGIVHRDVKPANLIVTPDRTVKVTDFGISRARAAASITGTGAVMGTPQYLSPEQARGETASPASDVYGLGVVAFECLMGRRPFDKDTPVATALAHLNDPVPSLPGIDPQLAGIVRRALAKNPRERYQDGHQFASALRMTGETTYVPPVVEQEPVPTQVIAAPPPALVEREPDRAPAGIWLLVVLGALVVVVVALFLLLRSNGSPPPTGPSDTASATTSTSSTTTSPSAGASPVALDEASYVGQPVDKVVEELTALGLVPKTQEVPNRGTDTPNTVAALSPNSGLKQGDTIQVAYYGAESTASATPSSTPTRSTSPSPTRSSSPTATSSATTSAPTTPSAPATSSPTASATSPAASISTDTPTTSAAAAAAARKDTR